jgi:hypothetical protein
MKTSVTNRWPSRRALLITASAAVGVGLLPVGWSGASANAQVIEVIKSPFCGCCSAWVSYLEQAGWRNDVKNLEDLTAIKLQAGVPTKLESCHTAFVDGYVIEGHVPLLAIEKLLVERPDLTGIAVPGMPPDAPGMSGGGMMEVIGFRDGAPTGVYTRVR